MSYDADFAERLASIRAEIAASVAHHGVGNHAPRIVAVTKKHAAEAFAPLLALGHQHFGENRVQEAQAKWPALKARHPDIVLHLIGSLQTNKAEDAVALFDVIESLDRPKLARALAKAMEKTGRRPRLFIQVNSGEEAQKGGVMPDALEALVTLSRDALGLPLVGLMCIPPVDDDPALHFALLAKLARRHGLAELSMGMSGDYALAAAMGATQVRIGTALVGPRLDAPA